MKTFTHLALLGRQPELGLVELESLLGAEGIEPFGRQTALLARSLDVASLGGVIKLGRVIYDGAPTDLQDLPVELTDLPVSDSKLPFALSVYAAGAAGRVVEAAGLSLKKRLRERGSVRLIMPANSAEVSVAQLKHNRVIEDGFELMVAKTADRMIIAITEQIQDIDWYSRRDYDRPSRSAKVGMLPPKLAQVLINTTASSLVIDPFCGTGVILQEALLMGRPAQGSDIAPEMVEASRVNLEWLASEVTRPLPSWQAEPGDARTVVLTDPAGAVVSEGYLGPNLTSDPTARLGEIRAELGELYRASLANWARQLASGAELALCVPAWRTSKGWEYLGLVDDLPRLGYTVKVFKHAPRSLLYQRDDQTVGRQLLLLRKI